MNNEEDTIIYCSRCGAEMKSSSRYCMKCGNINYDHEANQSLRYLQPKEEKQVYQIGSGQSLINNEITGVQNISVVHNIGNGKVCFLVNYGVYLLVLLASLFISFKGIYSMDSIVNSSFPLIAIFSSILFLYFYSIQLVYVKSDRKWWYAFIPIYNIMVLSDIAFHKKYLGLLLFVPVVGFVFYFILFYQLGKKFQYSGILTMLFPFIMVPVIAFGIHFYEGRTLVDTNDKNYLEKNYRYRKVSLITVLLFSVIGISLFIFGDLDNFYNKISFMGNNYYVYVSNQLVKHVEQGFENSKVSCGSNGTDLSKESYTFHFNDVGDETYLWFYYFHNPIQANVYVENNNGKRVYYVELSDGTYGFPLTKLDTIDSSKVVQYAFLQQNNSNSCQIHSQGLEIFKKIYYNKTNR